MAGLCHSTARVRPLSPSLSDASCPFPSALDEHCRSKQLPRRSEVSDSRNGDVTDDDSMGSWMSASPEEGGSAEHKKQKGGVNRQRFAKPKVRERQRGEWQWGVCVSK